MQRIRLKQANRLGPSGFVSMDDSELLKPMQTQVAGDPEGQSFIEMGGRDVLPQVTMATEVVIRHRAPDAPVLARDDRAPSGAINAR